MKAGVHRRNRTLDQQLRRLMLYPLSYVDVQIVYQMVDFSSITTRAWTSRKRYENSHPNTVSQESFVTRHTTNCVHLEDARVPLD